MTRNLSDDAQDAPWGATGGSQPGQEDPSKPGDRADDEGDALWPAAGSGSPDPGEALAGGSLSTPEDKSGRLG